MLTCVHHVQWVRPIAGGLHQCIQCQQVVGKKDVHPKLEDLSAEFRARWDEHEASTAPAAPAAPAGAARPAVAAAPRPAPAHGATALGRAPAADAPASGGPAAIG